MSPRRKPSTRQMASSRATHFRAVRSASRLVLCRPRESMPRTQRTTIDDLAAARSTSGYSSSRPASVCCLESFRRARARRSDSVRRSMSNKTAAVTSGPARLPRPASSAPAMKRRSQARSKANSFRPRGRFLGGPEPFRRPVGEEGSADDPVLLDRAPDAAVGGVPTVVAHHKKLAPRNRDGLRQVARFARFVRTNKWLLLLVEPSVLAFEEDAASLHVELVAPD